MAKGVGSQKMVKKPKKDTTPPKAISLDTQNSNKGTTGVNQQSAKANGNRGKQLNPNQKKK